MKNSKTILAAALVGTALVSPGFAFAVNPAVSLPSKRVQAPVVIDPSVCRDYAQSAVAKSQENEQLKCGLTGDLWNQDVNAHLAWCRNVPNAQAGQLHEKEQARDNLLAECKAQRCEFGDNDALRPYGLIDATWEAFQAKSGPLGCPVEPEADAPGRGRIQTFQFGQIAWSPNTGGQSVQIAYQAGSTGIEVLWAGTDPFNYDFWIVRSNSGQTDVGGRRTDGWYVFENAIPGQTYSFSIEGCDDVGVVAGAVAECKQGWMNPVGVTIKPNPNKGAVTLPAVSGRERSCWLDIDCLSRKAKDYAQTIKAIRDATEKKQ